MNWPKSASDPAYEALVLDAVKNGQAQVTFTPITSSYKNHTATFYVTSTPIKIDGFYPGMGARIMQRVADILECTFLTARLSDLAYMQRAVTVTPITLGMMHLTTNEMMFVSTMRTNSKMLDDALVKAGYSGGLFFGPGKPWIIDNQLASYPGKAENYGQYVPQPGGTTWLGVKVAKTVSEPSIGVIQGYWWPPFHGTDQDDYVGIAQGLLSRYCIVDGTPRDTVDVMSDPELCGLMVHDGKPLLVGRQPGIAPYNCVAVQTKVGMMCTAGLRSPMVATKGSGASDVAIIAGGVAVGAAIGGPVGALVGAVVGGVVDFFRRAFS